MLSYLWGFICTINTATGVLNMLYTKIWWLNCVSCGKKALCPELCTTLSVTHIYLHTPQKQCFSDTFNGCVSKPSPPKKLRLSNRPQQQKQPSSLPLPTVPPKLPDFFDSDEEESDFYGFPAEVVLNGAASSNQFTYYLPQKWKHLFDSEQEEDDFDGFTKEELYVVYT